MKLNFNYFFLFVASLMVLNVCVNPCTYAQNESKQVELREIKEDDWNKARKGISYKKNKVRKQEVDQPKKQHNFDLGFLAPLKWGFVAVVVLILAFAVVWIITKGQLFGNKAILNNDQDVFLTEEDIEKVEFGHLEQALQKALLQKNFKMAIRIHYLWILKVLYEKELIKWKKDKTNHAYVNELAKTSDHQEKASVLRKLTIWYEKAWYSNEFLTETDYFSIEPHFIDFRTYYEVV